MPQTLFLLITSLGNGSKFVSDGSDFVFGREARGNLDEPQVVITCIKFNKTDEERRHYESVLQEELQINSLFRDGWESAKNLNITPHPLTQNETLAVVTYTLHDPKVYSKFNNQTRELGPKNPNYHFKAMYYLISMAIEKLSPKHLGKPPYKVYRGVSFDVTDVSVGSPYQFTNFASTSLKESVAMMFKPKTMFIIEDTYEGGFIGKHSAFPEEEEVLVTPCEKFQVVDIKYNNETQLKEIHLKDLTSAGVDSRADWAIARWALCFLGPFALSVH